MTLGLALNNALSGLRLNQNALSVLSQNLANVNTEGYSRQYVAQSAVYTAGVGNGVKIDNIIRKVDDYLLRAVQKQSSELERSGVINDYQARVQSLLGQPGASNSLDAAINNFFSMLQRLADTPDSSPNHSSVISSAHVLAGDISSLAISLEDLRFQADHDIQSSVDVINRQLSDLHALNVTITNGAIAGQPIAGLLDARDTALRKLAEHMDIAVNYDQYGGVVVTASNGVALVDSLQHQLTYQSAGSLDTLINGEQLGSLQVISLDDEGVEVGSASVLIASAASADVESEITSGKIGGLVALRDTLIPKMLDDLDMLAANLRDAVNAIQNSGTAFPPPNTLTGTRAVSAADEFAWSGQMRIAVLTSEGAPIPASYADESATGMRPFLLDFDTLDSGNGEGRATVQTIIDEINHHFTPGSNKVKLGTLNNIELVSAVDALPTVTGLFDFDFELENITGGNAQFFITNIAVLDDAAANITNVTQAVPTILLSTSDTYTTTNGSSDVTITLQDAANGVQAGDTIYLTAPSLPGVNGITPAELTGYVTVVSVDGNEVVVRTTGVATATGSLDDVAAITMQPPFNVAGGAEIRSKDIGLQVDLSANPVSDYYDITVTVAVVDVEGNISNSDITYRIENNQTHLFNDRYSATAATGDGVRVLPNTTTDGLRAIMVDGDGNELPSVDGRYLDLPGYLKIIGGRSNYGVSIDSLDSQQLGDPDASPVDEGTDRGFSFFFELNNFFESNEPISTGDTVKNSALRLAVAERILNDPNLVATGQMTQSSPDPNGTPQYTYELFSGDNSVAARFSALANVNLSFSAAGSLPAVDVTISAYTGYLLASISADAATAENSYNTAKTFYEDFKGQADAFSGVNLDEELANTVIFQNAYSATARIITIVNEMFSDLIDTVR